MRRRFITMGSTVAAAALLGAMFAGAVGARTTTMLEFGSMTGVPAAYVGAQNPIRGINGGGFPWVVAAAKGELTAGGSLELRVTGLVIDPTSAAAIAAGVAGKNPLATMKATVSCQNGAGGVTNVSTAPFPITTGLASAGGGDGQVEADLSLPQPCIAPIVFVGSNGGAWFAATGY